MSDGGMTESIIEQAAFAWLKCLGWTVKQCPEIMAGDLTAVVQACLVRNSMDENGSQHYSRTQGNGA